MNHVEVRKSCCDVTGCPYSHEQHGHIPDSVRNWIPENKLEISQKAKFLADIILRNYDGLTEEQRSTAELEQKLTIVRVEYDRVNRSFTEQVSCLGELALL